MPHRHLLAKLQYYKINSLAWKWIQSWLTERTQSVVVDGASSKPILVLSGVPHGTVLSPLMFLCTLMILQTKYPPHFANFADDYILY